MDTDYSFYKEFIAKRHLDELTNEDDIKAIKRIFEENIDTLWLDPYIQLLFQGDERISDAESLQTIYLRTIMEQNFIMIRQLERISRAVGGETEKQLSKAEEYLRKKQEAVNEERQEKKEDMVDIVIHMGPEKKLNKAEEYLRKKQEAVRNAK